MKSGRTTWLLFLLAIVAAGAITMWSASRRPHERPAPRPASSSGETIELELAE
jgi:hypothetical protein